MKEFVDYYKILGINERATTEQVNEAFRKKVAELRPDIRLDETTREAFEQLKAARSTLIDPHTRRDYDIQHTIYFFQSISGEIMGVAEELGKRAEYIASKSPSGV